MTEDDIPPLEDMSTFVDRIKETKQKKEVEDTRKKIAEVKIETSTSSALKNETEKSKNASFAGMKKGFLFGSKPNQKLKDTDRSMKSSVKSTSSEKVDFVLKPTASAESSLVFNDVQNAMKADNSNFLQNKDWINDDLLKNIEGNEKLTKQLTDPKFSQAIDWMKRDPKAAMEYYKNDSDVQQFFKHFYQILGQHFMNLGDAAGDVESTEKGSARLGKSDAVKTEEDIKMEKILSNPELRNILSKPDVQNLISMLRNDPDHAQRLVQTSDPRLKADIEVLVSAGLLAFQAQ